MMIQTLIVIAIVAGALAYVAAKVWRAIARARRATKQQGCVTCGCEPAHGAPASRTFETRSSRS